MNKLWKRFSESLDDENGQKALRRLMNNTSTITSMFESNGMLTEANKVLYSLKTQNKKINLSTHDRRVDNVLVYIFLKNLMTLPTKAYRLGLINADGVLIRNPETKEENDCISNLDLLMFKIRNWLKPKMGFLSQVSWIKGVSNDIRYQNYFSSIDMVSKHYIIRKINDELDSILKKG